MDAIKIALQNNKFYIENKCENTEDYTLLLYSLLSGDLSQLLLSKAIEDCNIDLSYLFKKTPVVKATEYAEKNNVGKMV